MSTGAEAIIPKGGLNLAIEWAEWIDANLPQTRYDFQPPRFLIWFRSEDDRFLFQMRWL